MRRLRLGFLALAMAVAAVTAAFPAAAGADTATDEAAFVARINQLRAAKHLQPLRTDARLTALARTWAQKMAAQGAIFHNMQLPDVAPTEWIRLGENVGVGDSGAGVVDAIHQAFVASPTHYRNLIGRYTSVGVGVVEVGGRTYVAEEFMASAGAAKYTSARHRSHGWSSARRR